MSLPAGYGGDVTDSMGGTLHRRRRKDNVGRMTLQGLGYVATVGPRRLFPAEGSMTRDVFNLFAIAVLIVDGAFLEDNVC